MFFNFLSHDNERGNYATHPQRATQINRDDPDCTIEVPFCLKTKLVLFTQAVRTQVSKFCTVKT